MRARLFRAYLLTVLLTSWLLTASLTYAQETQSIPDEILELLGPRTRSWTSEQQALLLDYLMAHGQQALADDKSRKALIAFVRDSGPFWGMTYDVGEAAKKILASGYSEHKDIKEFYRTVFENGFSIRATEYASAFAEVAAKLLGPDIANDTELKKKLYNLLRESLTYSSISISKTTIALNALQASLEEDLPLRHKILNDVNLTRDTNKQVMLIEQLGKFVGTDPVVKKGIMAIFKYLPHENPLSEKTRLLNLSVMQALSADPTADVIERFIEFKTSRPKSHFEDGEWHYLIAALDTATTRGLVIPEMNDLLFERLPHDADDSASNLLKKLASKDQFVRKKLLLLAARKDLLVKAKKVASPPSQSGIRAIEILATVTHDPEVEKFFVEYIGDGLVRDYESKRINLEMLQDAVVANEAIRNRLLKEVRKTRVDSFIVAQMTHGEAPYLAYLLKAFEKAAESVPQLQDELVELLYFPRPEVRNAVAALFLKFKFLSPSGKKDLAALLKTGSEEDKKLALKILTAHQKKLNDLSLDASKQTLQGGPYRDALSHDVTAPESVLKGEPALEKELLKILKKRKPSSTLYQETLELLWANPDLSNEAREELKAIRRRSLPAAESLALAVREGPQLSTSAPCKPPNLLKRIWMSLRGK